MLTMKARLPEGTGTRPRPASAPPGAPPLPDASRITSRHNPLVARFREAATRAGSDPVLLLDGEHLVTAALDAGARLDVVAVSDDWLARAPSHAALGRRLERLGVRVVRVTPAVLAAISPVRSPTGIVALAEQPEVGAAAPFEPAPALVLVLVGVQDPGNVGAIVRIADAFGATGVIAAAGSADPFGWKALRGAMGSTFRLPVQGGADLDGVLGVCAERRVAVVAAASAGGAPPERAPFDGPCAILLGAEGGGLAPSVARRAALLVTIPMRPAVESLNVAAAAAVLAYEARRRRASHA